MPRFVGLSLLGLLVFGSLAGCGGPPAGYEVQVRVVSNTLPLEENDSLQVVFTPTGDGQPATATGNVGSQPLKAGRGDASGVVPGNYKVSVSVTPYPGMNQAQRRNVFKPVNEQFDLTKTPLTYEVTSGAQAVTIDLDAKTVTKG